MMTDAERLLKYVEPEPNTGCWLWSGGVGPDGYGRFRWQGRTRNAHRAAYALLVGIADSERSLMVDHICRVRSCVNPDHLRLVTARQNAVENSVSRPARNASKTHCPKGHPLSGDNVRGYSGRRHCLACDRDRNIENPERLAASRNRLRAKRAMHFAAGLTSRGTPRKNRGYDLN